MKLTSVLIIVGAAPLVLGIIVPWILRQYVEFEHRNGRDRPLGLIPMVMTKEEMARFRFEDIEDGALSGKIAVVTGGNAGLGFYTVKHLAAKGAHVVIASRNLEKCTAAKSQLAGSLECMDLDLASIQSVKLFTNELKRKFSRLDILVMNAGIGKYSVLMHGLTKDGIDEFFQINHLGHFKMFLDLQELVENTGRVHGDARIVVVSSAAHYEPVPEVGIPTTLESLNNPSSEVFEYYYGMSKLANVLFAQHAASIVGENVFVNACHPGGVASDIWEFSKEHMKGKYNVFGHLYSSLVTLFQKTILWDAEAGALTQVYLAASPEIETNKIKGKYFHPVAQEAVPSQQWANGNPLQERLWEFSLELVNNK